jgi:hypothetical protein
MSHMEQTRVKHVSTRLGAGPPSAQRHNTRGLPSHSCLYNCN